jgi:hypothetical protein
MLAVDSHNFVAGFGRLKEHLIQDKTCFAKGWGNWTYVRFKYNVIDIERKEK